MAIEDFAKKYANAIPNSRLVKYYEAAIPQYRMDMVLTMEKEKPLSVLQEFILKFLNEGIEDINVICNFLGINITAVHKAIADMQTAELITVDVSKSKVKFTDKGKDALKKVKLIVPEEIEYALYMNSFTGEVYIDSTRKYTKKDIKNSELVSIPPNLDVPKFEEIHFEDVKSAIVKYRKVSSYLNDKLEGKLLDIAELEKVYVEYNKVSVLVYLSKTNDIELRVFEKQTRRQEYEIILMQMYNHQHTHIFEWDEKEELDSCGEHPYYDIIPEDVKDEAVQYSNRSFEIDREIEQLKTQLMAYNQLDEGEKDDDTRHEIAEIQEKIAEREEERQGATKIISTYDHRPLLIKALKEAHNTVVIVSPWIKRGGLNNEILELIKSAVNRGVRIIIGYGISEKRDSDYGILKELNKITTWRSKGKLELFALNNTHEKVLIMDNKFLVVTSFNWLSFSGDPNKGFRQETGIYTESIESICTMKKDLERRMFINIK